MASSPDAQLANHSAAELVRVLHTTCCKADFDAVARLLSALERRAAETEAQLQAARAEIDALRRKDDAHRGASQEEDEDSARLGWIADEVEARLKAALSEIHAVRKRHDEESARLGSIADEAVAKLKAAFSEIRALRKKRDARSQAPMDETDECETAPHLGITTPAPALVPVQHELHAEQQIVDKEMEVSLERVWMEKGGRVDGSGVSLKRKGYAVDEDLVPPIQIPNGLQETMVATTPTAVASHTIGEKGGPSKLRGASIVGVTVSKRGKSVEATDEMDFARTILQEVEKKMSVARGRRGCDRGHRRGRGRGRNTLDKPVTASCSNFRCWLASPSSVASLTVVGGAGSPAVAPFDPPLVDGSNNQSEQAGRMPEKGFTSALRMLASAADASDSSKVTTNQEKDATLQKCSSRTNAVEAPSEVRSGRPFMPPNADVRVCSIYNNHATSGSDQKNGTSGHPNVGTKKSRLVLGTSSPVFHESEEGEIRRSFEDNKMSRFPSLSIHDISGAEILNIMGKRGNSLLVAEKLEKCVENKSDTSPQKLSSTTGLGKGVNIAGEGASHDGGMGSTTNYVRGASHGP